MVLYGGRSGERDVSLVSGRAVLSALEESRAGGDGPARVLGVEIDEAGRWLLDGHGRPPLEALERLPADALVFFGLHGGEGEDGRLQGLLEIAGVPFTGSGPAASQRCMDKRTTRALAREAGISVAPGHWLECERWRSAPERAARQAWSALARGEAACVVAKPNAGGSSVDTARVAGIEELTSALSMIFEGGDDALVEGWVEGLEATVGIVGNRSGSLRALPVVEIRTKPGRFFDYEEKYGEDGATETCPPQELSPEVVERLSADALTAYRTLGCDGYARADFIVPQEGGAEPVLLEVNTLPGFTPRSLLPQAASVAGASFGALCVELCALALDRVDA